jgi:hypothetical protein
MKDGKTEEAAALKASNDGVIRKYHSSQSVSGTICKINQQIQAVERSNIDRDAKRDEIRRLNARKDECARRMAA